MNINPTELVIFVAVFTIVIVIPLSFVGVFLFARKKRSADDLDPPSDAPPK